MLPVLPIVTPEFAQRLAVAEAKLDYQELMKNRFEKGFSCMILDLKGLPKEDHLKTWGWSIDNGVLTVLSTHNSDTLMQYLDKKLGHFEWYQNSANKPETIEEPDLPPDCPPYAEKLFKVLGNFGANFAMDIWPILVEADGSWSVQVIVRAHEGKYASLGGMLNNFKSKEELMEEIFNKNCQEMFEEFYSKNAFATDREIGSDTESVSFTKASQMQPPVVSNALKEIFNGKEYTFAVMPNNLDRINGSNVQDGVIYIRALTEGRLEYAVKDPVGQLKISIIRKETLDDIAQKKELPVLAINPQSFNLEGIKAYLPHILAVTAGRYHTQVKEMEKFITYKPALKDPKKEQAKARDAGTAYNQTEIDNHNNIEKRKAELVSKYAAELAAIYGSNTLSLKDKLTQLKNKLNDHPLKNNYKLVFSKTAPAAATIKAGNFYVYPEGTSLVYQVIDPTGQKVTAKISPQELKKMTDPDPELNIANLKTNKDLENYFSNIMAFAANKNHVSTNPLPADLEVAWTRVKCVLYQHLFPSQYQEFRKFLATVLVALPEAIINPADPRNTMMAFMKTYLHYFLISKAELKEKEGSWFVKLEGGDDALAAKVIKLEDLFEQSMYSSHGSMLFMCIAHLLKQPKNAALAAKLADPNNTEEPIVKLKTQFAAAEARIKLRGESELQYAKAVTLVEPVVDVVTPIDKVKINPNAGTLYVRKDTSPENVGGLEYIVRNPFGKKATGKITQQDLAAVGLSLTIGDNFTPTALVPHLQNILRITLRRGHTIAPEALAVANQVMDELGLQLTMPADDTRTSPNNMTTIEEAPAPVINNNNNNNNNLQAVAETTVVATAAVALPQLPTISGENGLKTLNKTRVGKKGKGVNPITFTTPVQKAAETLGETLGQERLIYINKQIEDHNLPRTILPSLVELAQYDKVVILIDDSASMSQPYKTGVAEGKSRWEALFERLRELLPLLAMAGVKVEIRSLNFGELDASKPEKENRATFLVSMKEEADRARLCAEQQNATAEDKAKARVAADIYRAAVESFADVHFQSEDPMTIAAFDFGVNTSLDAKADVAELNNQKINAAIGILGGLELRGPHGQTYVNDHFKYCFDNEDEKTFLIFGADGNADDEKESLETLNNRNRENKPVVVVSALTDVFAVTWLRKAAKQTNSFVVMLDDYAHELKEWMGVHGNIIAYSKEIWKILHIVPPKRLVDSKDGLNVYHIPRKDQYEFVAVEDALDEDDMKPNTIYFEVDGDKIKYTVKNGTIKTGTITQQELNTIYADFAMPQITDNIPLISSADYDLNSLELFFKQVLKITEERKHTVPSDRMLDKREVSGLLGWLLDGAYEVYQRSYLESHASAAARAQALASAASAGAAADNAKPTTTAKWGGSIKPAPTPSSSTSSASNSNNASSSSSSNWMYQ